MNRKVTFTGEVVGYEYKVVHEHVGRDSRQWHFHTFYVYVKGEGVYHWSSVCSGDKPPKPDIHIGHTHTFEGVLAVQIVGNAK